MCIAKVPTLRSRNKTTVSFTTVENNEPADAKNSKDTVMSGVDRELRRSRAKERKNSVHRENWWEKYGE
jgi:hypothetical protein